MAAAAVLYLKQDATNCTSWLRNVNAAWCQGIVWTNSLVFYSGYYMGFLLSGLGYVQYTMTCAGHLVPTSASTPLTGLAYQPTCRMTCASLQARQAHVFPKEPSYSRPATSLWKENNPICTRFQLAPNASGCVRLLVSYQS